jgi:hypothetical protein
LLNLASIEKREKEMEKKKRNGIEEERDA